MAKRGFPNEKPAVSPVDGAQTGEEAYRTLVLFVEAPAAIVFLVWGILRQLKDWFFGKRK